jgi:hypothetical protein
VLNHQGLGDPGDRLGADRFAEVGDVDAAGAEEVLARAGAPHRVALSVTAGPAGSLNCRRAASGQKLACSGTVSD